MGCKKPMIRIENMEKWNVAADGHRYHPARIEQPDSIYNRIEELKSHPNYKYTIIPCRKCMGCRLDYSKNWANRGYLEAKQNGGKHNYFVTLTYSDDHLEIPDFIETEDGITYPRPTGDNVDDWKGILKKEHFTKFIHDLRQIMKRDYNHEGFKFMGCGEYGGKGERPHYHFILFGIPLPPETFYNSRIINHEYYFQNTIIERCWKYGISNITTSSWNTIAYVCRYITKKINGNQSEYEYAEKGQIKEFFRMSRGIGKDYYENHKEEIYQNDEITIHTKTGATNIKPPSYFDKLYEKENNKRIEELKQKRLHRKRINDKILDEKTSIDRLSRLAIEERSLDEKHKKLIRRLEI